MPQVRLARKLMSGPNKKKKERGFDTMKLFKVHALYHINLFYWCYIKHRTEIIGYRSYYSRKFNIFHPLENS